MSMDRGIGVTNATLGNETGHDCLGGSEKILGGRMGSKS